MIRYRAKIKKRGFTHPVQKSKAKYKGKKFPATAQLYPKPAKGGKIQYRYYNSRMRDLLSLNGWLGFFIIRFIGRVIFNPGQANSKWNKPWNKVLGITGIIPYPIPDLMDKKGRHKPQFALGQGIACDENEVWVIAERGRWCRLEPFVAQLTEVMIGSNETFKGTLRWWVYPDDRSGEIWIEKNRLERLPA